MTWAKHKHGFTIVEILIVIVVTAILAAITIVSYTGIQQRASRSVAQNAVSQATKKVISYAIENAETYPDLLSVVGIINTDSTRYEYSVNNDTAPKSFCITVTVKGISYYQNNSDTSTPTAGACPGHTEGAVSVTPEPEPEPEPLSCAPGYIVVPGNSTFDIDDFCVMKYEAKNVSSVPTSTAGGLPWTAINYSTAVTRAGQACDECHLITNAEWLTIAHNLINVDSNWSGGAVGSGRIYSGHNDNAPAASIAASTNDANGYTNTGTSSGFQRRTLTLSNGEVIWDFAGNVSEWIAGTFRGGQPGVSSGSSTEWKDFDVAGAITPNPFPSFGTPAAANWTSAQGIGQAVTSVYNTEQRAVIRGGAYNSGAVAGVFGFGTQLLTNANATTGFRSAY